MRIYRQLAGGSRYHYYLEHEGTTVLWYPELAANVKEMERM